MSSSSMDCGEASNIIENSNAVDEGRNYVMAPPLPVDPSDPNTQPILRHVKIKDDDDDDNNDSSGEQLVLDLDDDEKHLFASIHAAAKAWKEGLIDFGENTDRSRSSSSSATAKPPGGVEVPIKPPQAKSVQVRVAGGWVRDKILGLQSHDVDIALDTCTGVEFATVLKTYVETIEQQQQQNDGGEGDASTKNSLSGTTQKSSSKNRCGRIGVIAANPDQSKHLETATMRIFGVEVDFSNLRHETYAEDSRIPETVMGTPLEDAYRRDFTMNSLFYNIHTRCIEDWTRRGLSDLGTKVVQTPLEAYQTFHDDPLRVLRAIRFAVRYDMELSSDLRSAVMHPQIHMELHRKVSRERVGKELEGMLSGKHANPQKAIDLICSMKLAGSVFCIPASPPFTLIGTIGQSWLEQIPYLPLDEVTGLARLREVAWEEARECIKVLPQVLGAIESCRRNIIQNHNDISSSPTNIAATVIDSRLVYLSTVLLPFEHLQYLEKQKPKSVAEYMIKDGIKFKTKDITSVVSLVSALDDMVQLIQSLPESTPATRLQAGMILRTTKHMWVTTMIVATVSLLRRHGTPCRETRTDPDRDDTNTTNTNATTSTTTRSDDEVVTAVDWCARAQKWYRMIVSDMKLDECWTIKPLMNGKDLMQYLGLPKGPQIGVYTQEQVKWMLMTHPGGTVDELQRHLKRVQEYREREENQAAQHISKKMHL